MELKFDADQIIVKKLTNRTFKVEMWVNEDEALVMGQLLAVPDEFKTKIIVEVDDR